MATCTKLPTQLGVEIEDVEAVLQTCQGFEPTGVMARNLQECLSLQLIGSAIASIR